MSNDSKNYTEEQKHMNHVLGGYKATLSNANSSEEAKKHAEKMIDQLSEQQDAGEDDRRMFTDDEKHYHHVLGGYKATLSNANSSEEAKKNAQAQIDEYTNYAKSIRSSHGKGKSTTDSNKNDSSNKNESNLTEEEKHRHHVEGGYKATLSNDKASEQAKKHAQEMLDKIAKGEELPESERFRTGSNKDASENSHVAGGYKATLANPNSSEEAKKHAQEMLDKAGIDADERLSGPSDKDATDSHVAGGYKATLSNPNASEEAKKHAQEMLDKAGVDANERAESSGKRDDLTEEEKHRHHVEGGYKATLSNDNASEEAKKHAQEMLDKIAKGEELPESEKRGTKRSTDEAQSDDTESGKGKQGFASMPKEKVQEIASKGGRTANAGEEPAPKKGKTENNKENASQSAK